MADTAGLISMHAVALSTANGLIEPMRGTTTTQRFGGLCVARKRKLGYMRPLIRKFHFSASCDPGYGGG